jgi:hypothetical protein
VSLAVFQPLHLSQYLCKTIGCQHCFQKSFASSDKAKFLNYEKLECETGRCIQILKKYLIAKIAVIVFNPDCQYHQLQ